MDEHAQTHIHTHTRTHARTHARTHTHTHTHTYIHTHTNGQTFRRMQQARIQCVAFRLKSGCRLTPFDVSWQIVVHLHSIHPLKSWQLASSVRPLSAAAFPIGLKGSSALCTCQCIPFESLTLKMKVKFVDENWQTKVPCQRSCMQNLALVGLAVCSQ